jgi:hypothetical protein
VCVCKIVRTNTVNHHVYANNCTVIRYDDKQCVVILPEDGREWPKHVAGLPHVIIYVCVC